MKELTNLYVWFHTYKSQVHILLYIRQKEDDEDQCVQWEINLNLFSIYLFYLQYST